MDAKDILAIVLSKKGQITTLTTEREVKVKKGQPTIFKSSKFQVRIGCNYENLATTKQGRENGNLPETNAGLPWGEWDQFPYTITHKGKTYLRVTAFNGNVYPVEYHDGNGNMIGKSEMQKIALASEFSKGDTVPTVFNIPLDTITSIK